MLKERTDIDLLPIGNSSEFQLADNLKIDVLQTSSLDLNVGQNSLNPLVLEARKSYGVYGDVPLFDNYDLKSKIYLGTATYTTDTSETTSEHITMRLVPAGDSFGEPFRTEDLDLFVFEDSRGSSFSIAKLLESQGIGCENIASISRLGKIASPQTGKSIHVPELFAAVQINAANDAQKMGIEWIVCQLHDNLQNKALAYHGRVLDFVPIETQLGISSGRFHLDRSNNNVWDYMAKYPGYFLDIGSVQEVLSANGDQMLHKKTISKVLSFMEISSPDEINWKNSRKLGQLMAGSVDNILFSGDELLEVKKLLREDTKDGVFLALMNVGEWRQSALNLLKYARQEGK